MFSGIVETQAKVISFVPRNEIFELKIERPSEYNDLHLGDSIAVNGVCLTVEQFDSSQIQFAVAGETLNITGWNQLLKAGSFVNVERSMKYGDRVHGHLVQGHVDGMGEVVALEKGSETMWVSVKIPTSLNHLVWKKGSITLSGVSLTVNEINDSVVKVCLIPETLKRTNLGAWTIGQKITVEVDSLARYFDRMREVKIEHNL